MPVLNWIGKESIVNHDKEIPFRLLKKIKTHSVGDSENMIIEGDNLEGLKTLMPYYQNKIKCIYIDPPYNTGSEHWIYNDNVNSPKIRKWIGDVVGIEGEDLTRHDKWLCMMYPRLKFLRELLKENGIIFVSIDDNEISNLKLLMDEIFGEENYLVSFYVQVRYEGKTLVEDSDFQKLIETVLVYGKTSKSKLNRRLLDYSNEKFIWKIKESVTYTTITLAGKRVDIFKKNNYKIVQDIPSKHNLKEIWASGKILEGNSSGRFFRDYLIPRQSKDELGTLYKVYGIGDDIYDYRYFTGPKKEGATKGKYYQGVPKDIFKNFETHKKSLPLENYFNYSDSFGNCRLEGGVDFRSGKKPVVFLKHLFEMALDDNEDCIILDSFAGSGSTGHAVLQLNKERKQNHKFILIELESEIAQKITSKRMSNVIKSDYHESSFQYCILSKPLFDKDGKIDEDCSFEDLASYVYFTETKMIFDKKIINKNFIGEQSETKYYLIFRGIGKNTLDMKFLKGFDKKERKVIYADNCTVSEDELERYSTTFKQIPYEVRVF